MHCADIEVVAEGRTSTKIIRVFPGTAVQEAVYEPGYGLFMVEADGAKSLIPEARVMKVFFR